MTNNDISNKLKLEEAKRYINEFFLREYGEISEGDYKKLSCVPLAYTTTEDEMHEIEIIVDLLQYRMETCIDGMMVGNKRYESLDALINNELSCLEFDSLVHVTEEQLKLFYEMEKYM